MVNVESVVNTASAANTEPVPKKPRPGKKSRTEQRKTQSVKSAQAPGNAAKVVGVGPGTAKNVMGFELNAKSARTAMVLSEILGPPVSRRKRGR